MLVLDGATPESSMAVGEFQLAMAPLAPCSAWILMSLGQLEMTGGVTSGRIMPACRTMTSKEQIAELPDGSLKVYTTRVVPTENISPGL